MANCARPCLNLSSRLMRKIMCCGMRTTNYKNTLTVSILSIHTCKARSAKRLVSAAPHIGHTARKLISQRGLLNGRGARRPTITIITVLMVMAGGRDNENKEGDMLMMTSVLLGKELTPIVWLSLHPFLLIRKYMLIGPQLLRVQPPSGDEWKSLRQQHTLLLQWNVRSAPRQSALEQHLRMFPPLKQRSVVGVPPITSTNGQIPLGSCFIVILTSQTKYRCICN